MKINTAEILDFIQRLFWLALLVYLGITIGRAISKNYQSSRQIGQLKEDIQGLHAQIERQELLNSYYQSDTFKELESRRRLGLKKPDEKVFILPKSKQSQGQTQGSPALKSQQPSRPEPNPRKWLRFLLGV